MRGKPHKPDLKARVVAALMSGGGVVEVAEAFNLPKQTVTTYKSGIPTDMLEQIRRKKGERLDELIYQCMVSNLEALDKQAKVVANETYIKKQRADSLAVLYGVIADKTIRLLEATTGATAPRQLEAGNGN